MPGQRFDFLDNLAKKNFSPYETRVIFSFLRLQFIYNNGGVIVSLSRLSESTGLEIKHVCRALRSLCIKSIIHKKLKNGLPFYSFTFPIQGLPAEGVESTPSGGSGGLPAEGIKFPAEGVVIRTSNKVINNISESKKTKNTDQDFKATTEERFRKFFDEYPGAWNKGIENKCLGKFLNSTPDEQAEFLKALVAYKKSKSVQDKKILSPINFLNSPKIIKQYVEEKEKSVKRLNSADDQIKALKDRAAADPPRESLKDYMKRTQQKGGSHAEVHR